MDNRIGDVEDIESIAITKTAPIVPERWQILMQECEQFKWQIKIDPRDKSALLSFLYFVYNIFCDGAASEPEVGIEAEGGWKPRGFL